MMEEIVSRSEIAKRAGVAPASITKACTEGKALHPALVGKKLDANHPAAIAYVAAKTGSTRPGAGVPHTRGHTSRNETKKAGYYPYEEGAFEVPERITAFADMTLRDIISKFGTDLRFLDWLKSTSQIEVINERRIKNAKSSGELVHRDLVKKGVIDPIDTALTKLLTDGAKTISRRATAMHDAGRDLSDIENFVKDQISSFIRPMKAKIKRTFEDEQRK